MVAMEEKKYISFLHWNFCSLVAIISVAILALAQWQLFPKFLDMYYHLCVMAGFNDAGGYVTKAFWEYAPVGRPHVYPPLAHCIMLILHKFGFSGITIARLLSIGIFPFLVASAWAVMRRVFNDRLAFCVVVALTSGYSFYLSVTNLFPFSLALIAGLWAFDCIEHKKQLAAGLFLGIAFYAHAQAAWLLALAFLTYGILNKQRYKACFLAIVLALSVASPMLFWQFYNRHYFSFVNVVENRYRELYIVIYALVLAGLSQVYKKRKAYCFFLALAIAMLPMAFTHAMRYWSGVGSIGILFLAGAGLEALFEKFTKKPLAVIAVILLLAVASPVFSYNAATKRSGALAFDATIVNILFTGKSQDHMTGYSIYYPRFQGEIAEAIQNNTGGDDIIYSDLDYTAGIFSFLSGRATSTAMLREVKPYADFDPIAVARLVIWLKSEDEQQPRALLEAIQKYGLRLIKETDLAYIYQNPSVAAQRQVQRALIPLWAVCLLILGYSAVIFAAMKRKKNI